LKTRCSEAPQSLEAVVERQRIDHFKIKTGADIGTDRERLRAVASLIEEYHEDYLHPQSERAVRECLGVQRAMGDSRLGSATGRLP
jgi:hypothetical protein